MKYAWIFFLTVNAAFAQSLNFQRGSHQSKLSLHDLKAKLHVHNVKIDDPVYGKPKSFDAFLLKEVLQLAGIGGPAQVDDEIIFTASDGYAPNTTFTQLNNHIAYLAFQEHGNAGRFALVKQGKAMITPGPFYVVWEEGTKIREDVPFPYQLVKIEVVEFSEKYKNILPPKGPPDSKEIKGFAVFKAQCLRCHSVNMQGGEIGPELNAPQNVTEYWRPDILKQFIKQASSFRYHSKMPDFTQLSGAQIDQILAYLDVMKNSKVRLPQ